MRNAGIVEALHEPESTGRLSAIGVAKRALCVALTAGLILLATTLNSVRAEEPKIYLIELYSTNQVLLHFNTDPNRAYTVQYLDLSSLGTNSISLLSKKATAPKWSNLAVLPAIPFPNHYIIVDTRTTHARIYRLAVEP